MDLSTKAIIETIGDTGYTVMTGADSDGNRVVEAPDGRTGEKFVVRADHLYTAVVELAQQVGIDLEDGLPGRDRRRVARISLRVDR